MSVSGYEQQILERVKHLPVDRQRTVFDFVGYLLTLEEGESAAATREVLEDEELMEELRAGDDDFAHGRVVRWDEIKDAP